MRERVDFVRDEVDNRVSGWRKEERFIDRCLELGDSAGVVSAEDWIGERGRKSRNLGLLYGLAFVKGVEPESVRSVLAVRAAVDDTVDTMEGGGDGDEDREGEAGEGVGGDADIVVKAVAFADIFVAFADAFVAFLVGRVKVESAVPGVVSQMTPLAFIVSLCGWEATITVLQTARRRKNSWARAARGGTG